MTDEQIRQRLGIEGERPKPVLEQVSPYVLLGAAALMAVVFFRRRSA